MRSGRPSRAAAWVVGAQAMDGMDMGVPTELGSFGSFLGRWVTMMAAVMLPWVIGREG